jgi:predicted  nucleic acid-binding Zn-ribbon protein
MIDTLKLKETLENNGFSNAQASSLSHAINDSTKDKRDLATKDELHQVRNELKTDIKEVRDEIKDLRHHITNLWTGISDLRKELTQDMATLENRIIHKLSYRSIVSQISIATVVITLMIYFHQNP